MYCRYKMQMFIKEYLAIPLEELYSNLLEMEITKETQKSIFIE